MTDAEYEKTKTAIEAHVEKWHTVLGLRWWCEVLYRYFRTSTEFIDAQDDRTVSKHSAATATSDWRYKHGTIRFNVEIMQEKTPKVMEEIVRHEMCHLILCEMREWEHDHDGSGLAHEERCVTELSMILGWVWVAGREEIRAEQVAVKNAEIIAGTTVTTTAKEGDPVLTIHPKKAKKH